jgi:hypothetical protein
VKVKQAVASNEVTHVKYEIAREEYLRFSSTDQRLFCGVLRVD